MNLSSTQQAGRPLDGVVVADFSELLPGPFFTQNLVELGATVTKIERPPHGDNARRIAPGLFASVNRGKHSVMADLKDPQQAAPIRELAAKADIVVEGFRPGVMERLGFGYDALSALNPRLVYVSLSGYGQTGAMANVPGHDINYLASAGVLALCGERPEEPALGVGIPLADLCGSMYALSSTMAALLQRERTGRGQHLDVSLTDCAMHWMNPRLGHFAEASLDTLDAQRHDMLMKPAYGVFRTREGQLVAIAAMEDHFWARLAEHLVPDMQLECYAQYSHRVADAQRINAAIRERVATLSCDELLRRLISADIPVSRVEKPGDLHESKLFAERALAAKGDKRGFVRYPVMMEGM